MARVADNPSRQQATRTKEDCIRSELEGNTSVSS